MAAKSFDKLIDEISNLTVLELADLVKELEDKFGVSAAMPVAAAAPAAAEAAPAAAEAKSEFTVKLEDMGGNKIAVIKALRKVTTLSLSDAKAKVEGAPTVISENVPKEEAEKMKKELEAAGAKVSLS